MMHSYVTDVLVHNLFITVVSVCTRLVLVYIIVCYSYVLVCYSMYSRGALVTIIQL